MSPRRKEDIKIDPSTWELPYNAMFGSPVYIHSHWYTFYNQINRQNVLGNIEEELLKLSNNTFQLLSKNIALLQKVHDEYNAAGIDLSLMQLNDSFLDVAQVKRETLVRNVLSSKVHKDKLKYEAKLSKLLDKWLQSTTSNIGNYLEQELYNWIIKEFNQFTWTQFNDLLELKDWLKSDIITKKKDAIVTEVVKKFINTISYKKMGVFSELELRSSNERFQHLCDWVNDLSSNTVWTPKNLPAKLTTIKKLINDVDANYNTIFGKGVSGIIGGIIGHAYEIRLAQALKEFSDKNFQGQNINGNIIISDPDIVEQAMQAAGKNITTDVDLGIMLNNLPKFSYGISAKTSIGGLTITAGVEGIGIDNISTDSWKFLFYVLLNHYALEKYSEPGDSSFITNNTILGADFEQNVILSIFMVQAVGQILGKCFVEKDLGDPQTLASLIQEPGGHLSLPIILSFPNKNIYTLDLLNNAVDEFQKGAQGTFNQKYLSSIDLPAMWAEKSKILRRIRKNKERPEGEYYTTLYDEMQGAYTIVPETCNPFTGNWFTFTYNYNKDWIQ